MPPRIEIATTDIVVVGTVDYRSLSAEWLREQGIVRPSEADPSAVQETCTDALYTLKGGAFQLMANAQRLTVQSSLGNAPVVKDLMIGLLLLEKASAVRAIGMNFHGHYKCESNAQWHKIGNTLLPKDLWNDVFPDLHAGMQTIQVRMEDADSEDRIEVTVQPSPRFPDGVYMVWNDHSAAPKDAGASWAAETIKTKYDSARIRSFDKLEEVLAKCS